MTQTHQLATIDRNRPKQANLRRSISSAYYAVFHLLIANAVLAFIPKKPAGLIPKVGRAFLHGEMWQACFAFKRKPLTDPRHAILGPVVTAEMEALASAFIRLQDARHSADYDTAANFSWSDALDIWADAESAFANWRMNEGSDEATVFLAALAFGSRWSK